MIWVAPQAESSENGHAASSSEQPLTNRTVTPQQQSAVCRVANAVRMLALLNMLIFPSSILNACKVGITGILSSVFSSLHAYALNCIGMFETSKNLQLIQVLCLARSAAKQALMQTRCCSQTSSQPSCKTKRKGGCRIPCDTHFQRSSFWGP